MRKGNGVGGVEGGRGGQRVGKGRRVATIGCSRSSRRRGIVADPERLEESEGSEEVEDPEDLEELKALHASEN